jgi:tetratricopeptide (TPR) repeat protein
MIDAWQASFGAFPAARSGPEGVIRGSVFLSSSQIFMLTIAQAFDIAAQHHQAGRLPQAEQLYRQILQADPQHVGALHLLGVLAHQVGRCDLAIEYISQALRLKPDNAEAHSNLGVALAAQGKLTEAVASYQQALRLKPDYAEAYNNLANAFRQQGKLMEAVVGYQQALRLKPDYAEAHNNLANAFRQQGKLMEAVAGYQRALHLKSDYAEAHSNFAMALVEQGRLAEAVVSCQQALRLKPDYAEAHYILGVALAKQGKLTEAVASYQQALRVNPDYAEAHNSLGVAHSEQGRLTEAVACYHQTLRLKPEYAEVHNNLANAFQRQGKLTEAVASFQQALRLKPEFAEAHSNLGGALVEQGRLTEAVTSCEQALRLNPDIAETHNNVGLAHAEQGRLTEAMASYEQALRLRPDYAEAHVNLAQVWFLLGDFERGWSEYEWRWKQRGISPPSSCQPLWDGSSLLGQTILLFTEQGLGDTLQFVRYAPLVQQHGATVIVQCQVPLQRLLATCAGIDRLVLEGTALPPFDVQAPLLSLPRIFRSNLATIPANVPYLSADPESRAHWQQQLSGLRGFKVGITWRGNPSHKRDRWRSVPLLAFAPLAGVLGVRLVSLQKGPGREQVPDLADRLGVLDVADRMEDFADTAAVMKNLDLVITVDTAVAHLAGALGVPVWVALPFVPDWRWLLAREDSPWYPSMRLFRQSARSDWVSVFERLTEALREQVEAAQGISKARNQGTTTP